MRRCLAAALAAVLTVAGVRPPAIRSESTYLDRLPPLIDREILFGDPEIAGGQISPDGRFSGVHDAGDRRATRAPDGEGRHARGAGARGRSARGCGARRDARV
ncbi:MAG: hypothetical protein HY704_15520 [Gemmatimonadetes bacterium]|nr:hypothetical protein [Gemmatimonadota bacterium]